MVLDLVEHYSNDPKALTGLTTEIASVHAESMHLTEKTDGDYIRVFGFDHHGCVLWAFSACILMNTTSVFQTNGSMATPILLSKIKCPPQSEPSELLLSSQQIALMHLIGADDSFLCLVALNASIQLSSFFCLLVAVSSGCSSLCFELIFLSMDCISL